MWAYGGRRKVCATQSLSLSFFLFSCLFFFFFYFLQLYCPNRISPVQKLGLHSPGKASSDRVELPNLQCMLGVLMFPYSIKLWHGLQVFNVYPNVNTCDCTWGHMDTCKTVCTESCLWEKNPLPHQGLEPASAEWWSHALPNSMSYIPTLSSYNNTYWVWPPPGDLVFTRVLWSYKQRHFETVISIGRCSQ